MLPGGATDKFGNFYEGLWTVYTIIDILKEKTDFIRLEPVDDYESKGVEFYVEKEGRREYHQVKSQNSRDGRYNLSILNKMKILSNFKEKLQSENNSKCVFISSDSAFQLEKLIQRSNAGNTFEEFKNSCLKDKDSKNWFQELTEIWKITEEKTYNFLKRIEVRTIDYKTLKSNIINHFDTLVSGDSENIVNILAQYVLENIHQKLDGANFWSYLASRGFSVLDWSKDLSIVNKIRESNIDIADYLKQTFICDTFFERNEVNEIFNLLENESIALLSGDANSGKSSILYGVLTQSISRGYNPYIIKTDDLVHINTKKDLKDALELPETPEKILANISKVSKGLLIIDQLDAVSLYSGRNADVYDKVIFKIIESSKSYDNLKVIIACRTVDLENDYRFQKLIENDGENIIRVSGLSEESIIEILEKFDVDKSKLNDIQIKLLNNPLVLYLQIELLKEEKFEGVDSLSQIYGKYWQKKKRSFLRDFKSSDWTRILSYVSNHMSSNKSLFMPLSKLEDYEEEVNKLLTENIFKKFGKNIYFFHESFFDYTFAKLFTAEDKDICNYLLENDQFLFRRALVRQILTYKKEEEDPGYYKDVEKLIENPDIRYHIKDLVFRFLNSLNTPSIKELNILEKYLFDDKCDYFDESWRVLISERWIFLLQKNDFFQRSKKGENEEVLKKAIELMVSFSYLLKENELNILKEVYEKYDSLKELIADRLFNYMNIKNQEQLELYGLFLEKGIFEKFLPNLNAYNIKDQEIFIFWLDKVLRYYSKKSKAENKDVFELLPNNLDFDEFLMEKKILSSYRKYIEIIEAFLEYSNYLKTNSPYEEFSYGDFLKEKIFNAFIICFVELSREDKALAKVKIDKYLKYENKNYDRLILEILKKASDIFSSESIDFLLRIIEENEKRLDLRVHEYYLFMKNISVHFNEEDMKKLEPILTYYPEWEKPNKRKYVDFRKSHLGYSQLYLLSGIIKINLNPNFDLKLKELKRKFPYENVEEYVENKQRTMASFVPSPISIEKLRLMNDKNLLRFIDKYNKPDMGINYDIHQLSWDLKEIAQENPKRFYSFVKKLSLGTYRSHISEIMIGLSESNFLSSDNIDDIMEYIYINFKDISGRCVAKIIENNPNHSYSDNSMKAIEYFSLEHPDPKEEYWKKNINGSDPYTNGINSTRGQMAVAIGRHLNNNLNCLAKFKPVVERITNDKTTVVKSCIIDALVAYYNNDEKEFSLDLLRKIIDSSDEELLVSYGVNNFLNYVFYHHFDRFEDVLYRMLDSNCPKLKECGGLHVGKLILNDRKKAKLLLQYCYNKKDVDIEKGLAKVFSNNIKDFKEVCSLNLVKLFESDFKEVRSEASRFYNYFEIDKIENYLELIRAHISSLAFEDNMTIFLRHLKSWSNLSFKIPDFIFEVFKRLLDSKVKSRSYYQFDNILKLICKVYEECEDDQTIEKCLNIIDAAFKRNIYRVESTLSSFER